MGNQSFSIKTGLTEIIKIFDGANKVDGSIAWQVIGESRIIQNINSLDYDLDNNQFSVVLDSKAKFEKNKIIYLKIAFRNAIFKVEVIDSFDRVLVLKFPDEVIAGDGRKSIRKKFTIQDNKVVTITTDEVANIKSKFEFKVLDISATGIAVQANEKEIDLLFQSSVLKLEKLNNVSLMKPIEMIIVYVFNEDNEKLSNRVGIIFRNELSQDLIEEFSK